MMDSCDPHFMSFLGQTPILFSSLPSSFPGGERVWGATRPYRAWSHYIWRDWCGAGVAGRPARNARGGNPSTGSPGTILLIPALHFPSGGNSPARVSCRWSCLWRSRGVIPAIFQKSRVSNWCLSH